MKRNFWIVTILLIGIMITGCESTPKQNSPAVKQEQQVNNSMDAVDAPSPAKPATPPTPTPEPAGSNINALTTESKKLSYAFGAEIGESLRMMKVGLDTPIFIKGFRDAFAGKELLLNRAEADKLKQEYLKKKQAEFTQTQQQLATTNIKEGMMFLEENKKKEGVKVTASGLQYQVLTEGDGAKPKATDQVTVHYKGTLIDGTEFDSSYKRNAPATFPLNGVIPGWTEGVQLMQVGSKFKFFIPSELGYGTRGSPPVIGPNATLIFEVELLSINK